MCPLMIPGFICAVGKERGMLNDIPISLLNGV